MSRRRPARLPAGMDYLPSGMIRVRVHVGEGKYRAKSFSVLDDAIAWQLSMRRSKETGTLHKVDADLQTFRALAAEHMAAKVDDLSEKTYQNYRNRWKHIEGHPIALMPLRAIGPEEVESLKTDLLTAGVGREMVRSVLALGQQIMERAVRFGRIRSNAFKAVDKPKVRRGRRVRPISPLGVERIRGEMNVSDALLVSVIAYSGLRPGEVRAQVWREIEARRIEVENGTNPDGSLKPTKTEEERSVRLVRALADDYASARVALGDPPDSARVFLTADGRAWTEEDWRNFAKRFKAATRRAGVDIRRPYDLRHAAASLWLHEGISIVQVAKWLGHDAKTLMGVYAHVIEDLDPNDRRTADAVIAEARRDYAKERAKADAEHTRSVERRAKATLERSARRRRLARRRDRDISVT